MKIHNDIAQGTPEWHQLRCGVFTASNAAKLLTGDFAIANNETSRGFAKAIARERMTGRKESTFESWDMARGKLMEPIARVYYEKFHNVTVEQVGFVTNEINGVKCGCSPDGLVGDDGGIQIKSRNEAIHFDEILKGVVPKHDIPQIQFELMVTGREWWDYVSFCDGWPLFVKRVYPDLDLHATLAEALKRADEQVAKVIEQYKLASICYAWTEKIPDADDSQLT